MTASRCRSIDELRRFPGDAARDLRTSARPGLRGFYSRHGLPQAVSQPRRAGQSAQPPERLSVNDRALLDQIGSSNYVQNRVVILCRIPRVRDDSLPNFFELPDSAGAHRIHGLTFRAREDFAELFEVLDGAIHAHPSH